MRLILTEKPSVARDFARALGLKARDGYFEGDGGLVTFAVGHLFELYAPDDYDSALKKWDWETLPIVPDKGCFLIERLRSTDRPRVFTDPAETARWEEWLHAVARGSRKVDGFLEGIVELVKQGVEELKALSAKGGYERKANIVGRCPLCGAEVIEGRKGYGCSRWREGCKFVIWKEICGKKISPTTAKTLLSGKTTRELKGFKSKKGKTFSARLKLEDAKVVFVWSKT